ncbi:hypothetical protein KVV02_008804 [Mortierella alpina]|uniref:dolichyl-phosphate-mannose--protein mannosyltransferase n=1 Tax=Mortierella alpina TaxID=64518 RepID=A0A9P7ZXY4_MORAP|nr:hypothetical protein KVV02_008804 [Mortierella alpina]
MSFGGFNPGRSSELPFTVPGNVGMRSRTSSVSSINSNHSVQSQHHHQQQHQQQQQPLQQQQQSPYNSRPGTPLGRGSEGFLVPGADTLVRQSGGYDGYGSGSSSPMSISSHRATPPPNTIPTYYGGGHHSRTHSNASETSLNIDTDLVSGDDGLYSPGPVSLSSSVSSSRRGSFSDSGSGGGFFNRKATRTFRPEPHQSPEDYPSSDMNENDDDYSSDRSGSRKSRARTHIKGKQAGKRGRIGMGDIFNDWDLLLPSADAFVDGPDSDEDDGLNEGERWKKRQMTKKGWESSRGQGILLTILVLMAVFVRIWKLAVPAAVVFDEQHFGGFVADYLKGEFFMDIHPPLGKMLYAAVAYMLGFKGNFDFAPGKLYDKSVPYIGMRLFAVACGVGLIPISYLTIKRSGHSTQAAIICAVLLTFENAMITQSRFVLLDAPMMFFMGYTMLSWINFYNHRNRPFTRGWWLWLAQTGFCLFLSSSVKWVGLFTIATIGVCVLKYLQEARTHLYVSTRDLSKQFTALFICLLLYPAVLYVGLHILDFRLLSKSGSGNAWVSPQFQMTLSGHDVLPVMADIAWDSKVHIRHANTNGGWVHSMPGEYTRDGSKDQAIQLVEWDDELTCWQVYPSDPTLRMNHARQKINRKENPALEFDGFIYDGDQIRLRHCYTKVALAANNIESVGSNRTFLREVMGARWVKQPTEETIWRLELVPEGMVPGLADHYGAQMQQTKESKTAKGKKDQAPRAVEREMKDGIAPAEDKDATARQRKDKSKQWHSIKGFRLWNEKQQCYLQSHKVFRAPYSTYQEVACVQGGRQKANTIFIVDQNVNSHLPESTPSISYQPLSFFQKFLELNRVMWWTHHDLSVPTHGEEHNSSGGSGLNKERDVSHPWTWPLMKRGMTYFSSLETNHYVHFMGNPLLWWMATASVVLYMTSCLWSAIKYLTAKQAAIVERDRFGITPFYAVASGTFFAGWVIHYVPFFFMSRQVFLHHYLPSLYFSILLFVSRLDRSWQRWPARMRYLAGIALMAAVFVSYYNFAPLAYGTDFGSRAQCDRLRALGGWQFTCQRQELAWARPEEHSSQASANESVGAMDDEDGGESHFYDEMDSDDQHQHHAEDVVEEEHHQQHEQQQHGSQEEHEQHQREEQERTQREEQERYHREEQERLHREEEERRHRQEEDARRERQRQEAELIERRQREEEGRKQDEERMRKLTEEAEIRAYEMMEKQRLIHEKLALEARQRELEESLASREREIREQKEYYEMRRREREEQERQHHDPHHDHKDPVHESLEQQVEALKAQLEHNRMKQQEQQRQHQ